MSDNYKLQLEIEANAGDARREIASVGDAAAQMAQKVQQAGAQAGQGMDAAGKAGEQAAEKFTRAERSIASAIQRTTAEMRSLGQGGSAKFEELISIRGYDPAKFRGLIGDLRLAEQQAEALARANARTGLSAKEMAFAMRGVPAQFTDIFTSIASGQRPLTVLLQQGGQLKDMFGGVGNAAKAMGGYLVRLINPYTLLTAAAGGLAVAYYQGSKEADAYAKSLILTGNAAGTSTNALAGMASQIKATGAATHGAAAEALALAAGTGKISGENIKLVADAALRMQKVAGVAVKETVDQFAELGKAPVAASLKLNETTNHLTESIFRQIKALEEQGMTVEAAALAQKAYADALTSRAGEIEQNLGYIEKLWKGVASEAKSAWDAMLGVGRKQTLQDRIKELETAQGRGFFTAHRTTEQDAELAALKAQVKAQDDAAAAKARANEQEKAGIALLQERDKYLSKEEQKQRELLKLTAQYEKSAQTGQNQKDYLAAVAGVMDKFTEKTKEAKAGIKAVKDEYAELMNKLTAQDSGLSSSFWKDLDTLHKQYLKTGDIDAYRRAVELLVTQQKFHQDAVKASAAAEAEWAKAANNALKEREKEIESLEKKARATEDEIRYYGLAKSEIESLIIARLEERRAIAAGIDGQEDVVAGIDREIEARRRLRDSYLSREILDANKKAAAESAKAWENFTRDIEQSLTDALMRSFEAGDNAGEAFVKTLQNTLKTAALKLAVQVVMQPVMGSMGQALGYTQGGAGGGGLGGMSNIFSPISNIATSSIGGSAFGAGMLSGVSESLLGASFVGPSASLAGNASIAAGASFGSFLPAIGIGLGLLSLFGGDLFGGKEKPPEINIQNLPKGYKWGMSAGAGPFGELQMAGKHLGETEQEVQKMVDALLKPMIQADTALAQLLTGAEVKAISDALEGWTSGEVEFEGEAQVQELVKARFAVISDTIGGWVDELADTVTGTSEEVYTALGQILAQRNAEGAQTIAEQILGADDGRFSEEGENLAATFNRLMSSLTTVNAAFDLLDQNLLQISADSGVWADKLVDAFGGLESLQGSVAAYYDKYYSDAEKVANTTSQLTKAFDKLGYELPDSKEELRKWIDSIPLLTDEQRKTYAELIKLAPAFSDLSEAMAKTSGVALDAAAAERQAEIEARRAMQKAAQTSVDAAREGLNTLKTDLAAESSRTAGGYAGGSYLDAAELERYSGFVEYLTEAGAELQKLADLNVADEMDGAINAIKVMMDEAGRELASRLSMERLLAGNAGGAIGAASAPGMAGLTWEGNAGAFNAQIAEVQARAAAGLLNAANANALTIPNIDSVLDHLIQTAGENPGGRGLLGVRAAAEAYSKAITDGVEQEIREGLAANLGRAGLESVAFYFGQIGEQAQKLAEASVAANDALAQTNAAIGRLTSVSSVFGQSATAAYYGFMDGGAEGAMYLSDPNTVGKIRDSSLIAAASSILASSVTTADAAKVASQLSGQFTDKRGASLLLDGLKQYDSASLETAFTRMNDALIKGKLTEDQYLELLGVAYDTYTGFNIEISKVEDQFRQLREAAKSLADELLVDKTTTPLNEKNRLDEALRQYLEDLAGAGAGSMESMKELERSSRTYLAADKANAETLVDYQRTAAHVVNSIRAIEHTPTATLDDVVAENRQLRAEIAALREEVKAGDVVISRNSRLTQEILEKWDTIGMPAVQP